MMTIRTIKPLPACILLILADARTREGHNTAGRSDSDLCVENVFTLNKVRVSKPVVSNTLTTWLEVDYLELQVYLQPQDSLSSSS